jgi:sterol carrier protein 2
VVLASEEFVRKHKLEGRCVEIVALEMATDLPSSFAPNASSIQIVGYDMSALAAKKAFAKAGIAPTDVQVVELHDCFSANELITYEALGLCEAGKAADLVRSNNNTYGGKYVVNPSRGLISKGHPLGATGLAQCSELTWQLRGEAEKRQVPNVKYGLQHNIGLGGAAVVGIYRLGFPSTAASAPAASSSNASSSSSSSSSTSSSLKATSVQHKSGAFFEEIEARIKGEGAAFVDKVNATIGFSIACAGGKTVSYVLDLKTKPGSVFVNDGSK